MGPDYQGAAASRWKKNIEAVRADPYSRMDAAKSLAEKTGTPFRLVRYALLTNTAMAVHFAKNPSKQSIHQGVAADWIKALPFVSNFQTLPCNGVNALFVSSGRVLSSEQSVNMDCPKSLDFCWDIAPAGITPIRFYASHKYTHDDGGSQDNQFADLMSFVSEAACLQSDIGVRFIALADGEFYGRSRQLMAPMSRMEELSAKCANTPYAHAMATYGGTSDLPRYIASVVKGMLKAAGRLPMPSEQEAIDRLMTI